MAGVTSAVGAKRGFDVGGSVNTETPSPNHDKTKEVAKATFNTQTTSKTGRSFVASALSYCSTSFKAVYGTVFDSKDIKTSIPNTATGQPVPSELETSDSDKIKNNIFIIFMLLILYLLNKRRRTLDI